MEVGGGAFAGVGLLPPLLLAACCCLLTPEQRCPFGAPLDDDAAAAAAATKKTRESKGLRTTPKPTTNAPDRAHRSPHRSISDALLFPFFSSDRVPSFAPPTNLQSRPCNPLDALHASKIPTPLPTHLLQRRDDLRERIARRRQHLPGEREHVRARDDAGPGRRGEAQGSGRQRAHVARRGGLVERRGGLEQELEDRWRSDGGCFGAGLFRLAVVVAARRRGLAVVDVHGFLLGDLLDHFGRGGWLVGEGEGERKKEKRVFFLHSNRL